MLGPDHRCKPLVDLWLISSKYYRWPGRHFRRIHTNRGVSGLYHRVARNESRLPLAPQQLSSPSPFDRYTHTDFWVCNSGCSPLGRNAEIRELAIQSPKIMAPGLEVCFQEPPRIPEPAGQSCGAA